MNTKLKVVKSTAILAMQILLCVSIAAAYPVGKFTSMPKITIYKGLAGCKDYNKQIYINPQILNKKIHLTNNLNNLNIRNINSANHLNNTNISNTLNNSIYSILLFFL